MDREKYENAEVWIKEMIRHMYDTGDVLELENAFDELVGIWGLRLPEGAPKIRVAEEYIPHSEKYDLSKNVWEMGKEMMKEQGRELDLNGQLIGLSSFIRERKIRND